MSSQEVLYRLNFLSSRTERRIELGLRDPLLVIAKTLLVLSLQQAVQFVFVMKVQPRRDSRHRRWIDWAQIFGLLDKTRRVAVDHIILSTRRGRQIYNYSGYGNQHCHARGKTEATLRCLTHIRVPPQNHKNCSNTAWGAGRQTQGIQNHTPE